MLPLGCWLGSAGLGAQVPNTGWLGVGVEVGVHVFLGPRGDRLEDEVSASMQMPGPLRLPSRTGAPR